MTQSIGLIAAMPEEIKPVVSRLQQVSREVREGFTIFRFSLADRQVSLIESGMGAQRAARATAILIETCTPDFVINFGFAGAVTDRLSVGDVVVASRVIAYPATAPSPELPVDFTTRTLELLNTRPLRTGSRIAAATFITSQHILNKREMASGLTPDTGEYVLDMETAAVSRMSQQMGIPLLALRAVSDGADEELGFSIEEFADETMTVRPWRVLATIARKPWIIPQLIRLAGNIRRAGSNLADAVIAAAKGIS